MSHGHFLLMLNLSDEKVVAAMQRFSACGSIVLRFSLGERKTKHTNG
jgi:hypothetical protein